MRRRWAREGEWYNQRGMEKEKGQRNEGEEGGVAKMETWGKREQRERKGQNRRDIQIRWGLLVWDDTSEESRTGDLMSLLSRCALFLLFLLHGCPLQKVPFISSHLVLSLDSHLSEMFCSPTLIHHHRFHFDVFSLWQFASQLKTGWRLPCFKSNWSFRSFWHKLMENRHVYFCKYTEIRRRSKDPVSDRKQGC